MELNSFSNKPLRLPLRAARCHDAGQIVDIGRPAPDGGISQGFTLIDGTYTSFNYPGATYTFP